MSPALAAIQPPAAYQGADRGAETGTDAGGAEPAGVRRVAADRRHGMLPGGETERVDLAPLEALALQLFERRVGVDRAIEDSANDACHRVPLLERLCARRRWACA